MNRQLSNTSARAAHSRISLHQQVRGAAGRTFSVRRAINQGGYGAVYEVKELPNGKRYALKEEILEPNRGHFKLQMEVQVLTAIAAARPRPVNFPTLEDRSPKEETIHRMYIIMTLLGESLADIKRRQPNRIFSPNTAYYCAARCLDAIQHLHGAGFIHRDIKPANFVLGRARTNDWNTVYMVDFGIARKCVDERGHMLTPRSKIRFKGTVRYASLAAHNLVELGRKDDCESWIYMIVDMVSREHVPWHDEEDRRRVMRLKERCLQQPDRLFNDEQRELRDVTNYLREQHYVDQLDYEWMGLMLRRVAARARCTLQPPFDWNNMPSCSSKINTG